MSGTIQSFKSLSQGGKDATEIILRPAENSNVFDMSKIRVIKDVQSKLVIPFFNKNGRRLRTETGAWVGGAGATKTEVEVSLDRMDAEFSLQLADYDNSILESLANKGVTKKGDINGTKVFNAEMEVFSRGANRDIYDLSWLGNKLKTNLANGTYDNGVAYLAGSIDAEMKPTNGFWKHILDNLGTGDNQIERVVIANGTVQMVKTVTLTGTTGSANINIGGVNYLANFVTSLTQTATNFVTANASTILLKDRITVTSSGADIILTAVLAGESFYGGAPINNSGDLAGSIADTTDKGTETALATDEALDTFRAMIDAQRDAMVEAPNSQKVIFCDMKMYNNYKSTLTALTGLESSKLELKNGVATLSVDGIAILPRAWNSTIASKFNNDFPYRAMLVEENQLALVLNEAWSNISTWYNIDNQERRGRVKAEFGTGIGLPELMVIAI